MIQCYDYCAQFLLHMIVLSWVQLVSTKPARPLLILPIPAPSPRGFTCHPHCPISMICEPSAFPPTIPTPSAKSHAPHSLTHICSTKTLIVAVPPPTSTSSKPNQTPFRGLSGCKLHAMISLHRPAYSFSPTSPYQPLTGLNEVAFQLTREDEAERESMM